MSASLHKVWANRGPWDAHRHKAVDEVRHLVAFVASRSDMMVEELTGKSRVRAYVHLRAAVAWIARRDIAVPAMADDSDELLPISYPLIGRALGFRDHSTIINLMEHAETWRRIDAAYAATMDHWLEVWRSEPINLPPRATRHRAVGGVQKAEERPFARRSGCTGAAACK